MVSSIDVHIVIIIFNVYMKCICFLLGRMRNVATSLCINGHVEVDSLKEKSLKNQRKFIQYGSWPRFVLWKRNVCEETHKAAPDRRGLEAQ